MLYQPKWAVRSCQMCRQWAYKPNGDLLLRPAVGGQPVPRHPGDPTPCATCPKIPLDEPQKTADKAIEVTPRTLAIWQHWQECDAVGAFPDDPLVRRNAVVIKMVLRTWERMPMTQLVSLFSGLANKR